MITIITTCFSVFFLMEVKMATWGLHMMIVDKLYEYGLSLNKKGFAVGNIAPDCNIENEDWTEFEPPRVVTHWMNTSSKLTADYDGFYDKYISGKKIKTSEEISFLYGYYSHLITDVEFQKFVRNDERVKNIFSRVNLKPEMNEKIIGSPENFDTIKKVFGKQDVFLDIYLQEINYLKNNEHASYNSILRNIKEFDDYIDYMPKGAITRKLKIITSEVDSDVDSEVIRDEFIFFSTEEIKDFIENTCRIIQNDFISKGVW